MNKQQWEIYYRSLRIHRREVTKAKQDMMLYGSGYISVVNGEVKHVPIKEVIK